MKGTKRKIELSEEEKKALIALSNKLTTSYRLVIRAKLVLHSAEGVAHNEIARKYALEPKVVSKWVKRWLDRKNSEHSDVEIRLADSERPGKPVKFTPEQKCKIIAIACEKPEVYNRPITHWTNKELADEVVKQGVVESISVTHISYILKKNDIRPHKVQYWLNGKVDEKKAKK